MEDNATMKKHSKKKNTQYQAIKIGYKSAYTTQQNL